MNSESTKLTPEGIASAILIPFTFTDGVDGKYVVTAPLHTLEKSIAESLRDYAAAHFKTMLETFPMAIAGNFPKQAVEFVVRQHNEDIAKLIAENELLKERFEEMSELSGIVASVLSNKDTEVGELKQWKEAAIKQMPDWQAIGKALDIGIGEDVPSKVLSKIVALKTELDETKKGFCDYVRLMSRKTTSNVSDLDVIP